MLKNQFLLYLDKVYKILLHSVNDFSNCLNEIITSGVSLYVLKNGICIRWISDDIPEKKRNFNRIIHTYTYFSIITYFQTDINFSIFGSLVKKMRVVLCCRFKANYPLVRLCPTGGVFIRDTSPYLRGKIISRM